MPSRPHLCALLAATALLATPTLFATPAQAAPGQAATPVPCPVAKAPPLPGAKPLPPEPVPPPRPADEPVVGGDALGTSGLLVPAGSAPLPKTISAQSWVLADLDSGEILAACAPHARHLPASTQKLLTALTALPGLDPKQVVTITAEDLAIEPGSSAVGLVKGGKYTVDTIALGMMLNSGNEAANALARLAGGSKGIPGGIERMNAEAHRIGALDTTAITANGLDGKGQFTSAYDLALIARADFALPGFRRYTATRSAVIPAQPPHFKAFQIQNDNRLLTSYPGAIGGKTGFTDLAQHTYMGAAQRNGRRLVVTMLRGQHRPQKLWQQGAALLDWGFALPRNAEPVGKLVSPEDVAPRPSPAGGAAVPGSAAALGARVPSGTYSLPELAAVGFAVGAAVLLLVTVVAMRLRVLRRRRRRAVRAARVSF